MTIFTVVLQSTYKAQRTIEIVTRNILDTICAVAPGRGTFSIVIELVHVKRTTVYYLNRLFLLTCFVSFSYTQLPGNFTFTKKRMLTFQVQTISGTATSLSRGVICGKGVACVS